MEISKGNLGALAPTPTSHVTGAVYNRILLHGPDLQVSLNLVKCLPGGRSKWHTHTFEQGMVVTEGKGIVATEEAEYVVESGDVVIVPENEKHWHGGTDTTGMTHIVINGSGTTTVIGPVEVVRTRDV